MANTILPIIPLMGVNLLDHPRRIQDTECLKSKNIVPTEPGLIATRPSLDYNSSIETSAEALSEVIAATFVPWEADVHPFLFATRSVANSKTTKIVYRPPASSTVTTDLGFVTPEKPCFLTWNNCVYVFGGPGTNAAGKLVSSLAVQDFTFQGALNASLRPRGACLYKGRFVFWDFGPGFESAIVMADAYDPTAIKDNALAADGAYFTVGQGDGDRVIACIEITQTAVGNASTSALLILKERSAYIATGEPQDTGDTLPGDPILGDLAVSKISYECGCASRDSVVKTPYGLVWAGPDDIWMFAQGSLPIRIGTKIQKVLKHTDGRLRYLWHAGYHDGFYRLAVAGEGQGPNDDSELRDQWWLDLRDGPPPDFRQARWWGPQQHLVNLFAVTTLIREGTRTLVQETRAGKPAQLYSVETEYHVSATRNIGIYQYGGSNGRDCMLRGSVSGAQVENCEIEVELLTKVFDFGEAHLKKVFQGLEVDLRTDTFCKLYWDVIVDEGASTSLANDEIVTAGLGWELDLDELDSTRLSDETESLKLHPPESARLIGRFLQFRLYSQAGFLIEEGINDQVTLLADDDGGGTETYTVHTLTPGLYTPDELLTHIVDVVTQFGVPGTFSYAISSSNVVTLTLAGGGLPWLDLNPFSEPVVIRTHAILGFPEQQAGASIVATQDIWKACPRWEIGAIAVKIRPLRRRPA